MKVHYFIPVLLLVGCAHPPPIVTAGADPAPLPQRHDDTATVRMPEQLKAYPVGRYEDPNDPDVMHEGHTVYRAESSPEWNTAPNEPTELPLGPGEIAVVDPAQQHVALTAELEQRLKQEDQLLQTTYEQNERLAQEIKTLEDHSPHVRLPESDAPTSPQPATASPQPQPQAHPASAPSPMTNTFQITTTRTWSEWVRSFWPKPAPPPSNPKGK